MQLKGNRIVAFAIATTVSSLIFALAHNDYKFIPIYFGMGVIFSLAYVWTKRLAVPLLFICYKMDLSLYSNYLILKL